MKPKWLAFISVVISLSPYMLNCQGEDGKPIRAGMVGLDTSHAVEFAKLLKIPKRARLGRRDDSRRLSRRQSRSSQQSRPHQGIHRHAAEHGSRDRRFHGCLAQTVDVVLIESVDGRPHLEQARR